MRRLLLRSLLIAVLVGPALTFVLTVASMRRAVKYEPGISEDEIKSYDNRPVSELQALLKSREVKLTRYQWLRESIGYAYFWEGIALASIRPCIGIFIGCFIIGTLERRRAIPLRRNDAAVPKERTLKTLGKAALGDNHKSVDFCFLDLWGDRHPSTRNPH